MEVEVPHFAYQFHAAVGNCQPVLAAPAGVGDPAPRLINLANTAGAALVPHLAGGIPAAGLAAIPALAANAPYTWAGLTNASLRIGLYPAGPHPAYEATWRVASLRVSAYTAAGGHLHDTPILAALDAGEKRALAYFTGVTLAVYTAGITGFTFPRHLSRHAAAYGGAGVGYTLDPAFAAANLPDIVFFNLGAGTCQVWEAKGRGVGAAGGGFAVAGVAGLLGTAIDQTRKLATVRMPGVFGALVAPNARIASVARVNPADGRWHLHVADPAQKRRREEGDPMEKAKFYEEFYRPFLEMIDGSTATLTVDSVRFRVAVVPGTRVRVGLDERIADLFGQHVGKRGRPEGDRAATASPEEICERIEEIVEAGYGQAPIDNLYISPEGILTEADEEDLTQPPA
ncbi:hypothetical protein [Embleya sp. MST-111070]|uniref:hypothetical protein n=1 Tax=Embleya sp. MST-111070 TaxID=3398231 RepID=UPI003F73472C